MRRIRATAAYPPVLMNKNREGGLFGLPCILSPEPRARGGGRRERERTLATVELAFPHSPAVRSDVGRPGAIVVGEVVRITGVSDPRGGGGE